MPKNKDIIRLDHILEAMFGVGEIDSKEKSEKLIQELESLPPEVLDTPIDFSKILDENEKK